MSLQTLSCNSLVPRPQEKCQSHNFCIWNRILRFKLWLSFEGIQSCVICHGSHITLHLTRKAWLPIGAILHLTPCLPVGKYTYFCICIYDCHLFDKSCTSKLFNKKCLWSLSDGKIVLVLMFYEVRVLYQFFSYFHL